MGVQSTSPSWRNSGTLEARMCWQVEKTPVFYDYEITGVDAAGHLVTVLLDILDRKSG